MNASDCAHTDYECDCDCDCPRGETAVLDGECDWPECDCGCVAGCLGCELARRAAGGVRG
jgi:hypothetical protein